MSAGVAALVMARAPRPGRVKTRLEPLLGPDGCARLQTTLIRHTARWACDLAPEAAFVAHDPADALAEVGELVPAGVDLFAQEGEDLGERLSAATERVFSVHGGPLVVVGTDLPALARRHATDALDDLSEGCDVSIGPAHDGGYYLLALRRPQRAVFALPSEAWGGPEVLELTLAAAHEAGLSLGLLRSERDLDTPADARAALADPALDPEIRAALTA